MRAAFVSFLVAITLLFAAQAWADDTSPVGTWTQVDDNTGRPKSIIEITELPNGTLQAVVKKVLFSDQGPHPICKACDGELHNKPVEGMTIMWGVKKDGDVWDGGRILDPAKGKDYRVELSLTDNGQKLDVKGFLLFFHRTQTWIRKSE